ncbi:hypothetical protein [Streptomyces sp. NPDC058653]|uniref:hypothetical protein n=1 Tax=Streptomyces sp. NPDC058653 TaxID=3346576 RepID=UPI003657D74E
MGFFIAPRAKPAKSEEYADFEWIADAPNDAQENLDKALDRIDALERTVKAGEHEHTELRGRLDRLERQLGAVLAAQTASRDDLAGAKHSDHQSLARQTRTLIEQKFLNFARRYADKCGSAANRPERERVPFLISLLCREFFAEQLQSARRIQRNLHLPEADGHIESALTALRGHCSDLTANIHRAGLNHTWDFSGSAGVIVTSTKQEAWPSCDANGLVRFVISPAYIVNNRVYCRQYVYTAS